MSDNKSLISAAHAVNNDLMPAEAATVAAAIMSTRLLLTMLERHQASGVGDAVALTAIGHAKHAACLSVEAREAHIRAHGALNIDLKRVGLERMYGKSSELPTGSEGDEEVRRSATTFSAVPVGPAA